MIVPAGPAMAPALAALHEAAFPPAEHWNAANLATLLAQPGVFALTLGAAAFIMVRVAADEAEILTLAVHPGQRRQGHALCLLQAAMARAAAEGASRLVLEVAHDNAAARALYRRAGFTAVGRRARYYAGGADALILAAPITCGAGSTG